MSEKFWIILIVAVTVLLVVLILRRQLKSLVLKGMGMEAEVQTHPQTKEDSNVSSQRAGVNITDFKQTGARNKLNISRNDVNVQRTKMTGVDQEIVVSSDKPDQN